MAVCVSVCLPIFPPFIIFLWRFVFCCCLLLLCNRPHDLSNFKAIVVVRVVVVALTRFKSCLSFVITGIMSHYYCVYIVVVPYIVIIVVFVVVCRFVYLFYWQFKLVTGFWVIANKKLTHSHTRTCKRIACGNNKCRQ